MAVYTALFLTDQWTLVTIPTDLCIAEVENEAQSLTITIRSTVMILVHDRHSFRKLSYEMLD